MRLEGPVAKAHGGKTRIIAGGEGPPLGRLRAVLRAGPHWGMRALSYGPERYRNARTEANVFRRDSWTPMCVVFISGSQTQGSGHAGSARLGWNQPGLSYYARSALGPPAPLHDMVRDFQSLMVASDARADPGSYTAATMWGDRMSGRRSKGYRNIHPPLSTTKQGRSAWAAAAVVGKATRRTCGSAFRRARADWRSCQGTRFVWCG